MKSPMVDVLTLIVIDRSPEAVSTYAANPDNAPSWYANIKSVEWKTVPPLRIGSRIAFVARFLGRKLAYTYQIVEFAPGATLVMRTAEGPFPMETTYTWESSGGRGTLMTLRNRGTPSGFARWMAPFMSRMIARANRKDLARLKKRLENV